jgi:hypothetical protein
MSLGFDTSLVLHRLYEIYLTKVLFCSYIVQVEQISHQVYYDHR